jgi:hypothetical protein
MSFYMSLFRLTACYCNRSQNLFGNNSSFALDAAQKHTPENAGESEIIPRETDRTCAAAVREFERARLAGGEQKDSPADCGSDEALTTCFTPDCFIQTSPKDERYPDSLLKWTVHKSWTKTRQQFDT